MKQKVAALVLLVLLGAAVFEYFRTGRPENAPAKNAKTVFVEGAQGPIVDQTSLLTAQRLAKMPTSAEEKPFAEEALRLADHFVRWLRFSLPVAMRGPLPVRLAPGGAAIDGRGWPVRVRNPRRHVGSIPRRLASRRHTFVRRPRSTPCASTGGAKSSSMHSIRRR